MRRLTRSLPSAQTMNDKTAEVKQTILNLKVTPLRKALGRKSSKPMTFRDMIQSGNGKTFEDAVKAFESSNPFSAGDLSKSDVIKAKKLLQDSTLADQPITMVMELQFYIDWCLHQRELCHPLYKTVGDLILVVSHRPPTPLLSLCSPR